MKRKDFEKEVERKMKAIDDSKKHHEKLIKEFNLNVSEMNLSISHSIKETEAAFERKLDQVMVDVKLLPHHVDHALKSIEIMHAGMKETQTKVQKEIMDLCKVDEYRMQ